MNNSHYRSRPISKGKISGGSLLLGILAVLYYFLQPVLNERLGWNVPKLGSPAEQAQRADQPSTAAPTRSADLLYGLLKEIQPDRYISPEGLLYGPGSEEGHRLKHLERHVKDQPTRPGAHGVFDGGMEAAVAAVDEAYARAQKKSSGVTSEEDGRRTIHTVNMGRRIGFVGGVDGKRKRNPQARRLRLVLEGNRVITAFPL